MKEKIAKKFCLPVRAAAPGYFILSATIPHFTGASLVVFSFIFLRAINALDIKTALSTIFLTILIVLPALYGIKKIFHCSMDFVEMDERTENTRIILPPYWHVSYQYLNLHIL